MAIDKKLAEKVAKERYVVLKRGVDEAKKKKMEMESMMQKMKVKIDEMHEKKGDQDAERSMIEELDESLVRMTVDYESSEVSADVKEELKVKLDKVEMEKKEWVEKYLSRKKDLKALIQKNEELENHVDITNKYLGSY